MNGLTRTDLTVAGLSGATLAAVALHFGVPAWLLPFGAAPPLTLQTAVWLAAHRDGRYAEAQRAADAARFAAEEAAHIARATQDRPLSRRTARVRAGAR